MPLILIWSLTLRSIMLILLLMTTVANADAGYHYDVPNVPFNVPNEQLESVHVRTPAITDFNGLTQDPASRPILNSDSVNNLFNSVNDLDLRSDYARAFTPPVNAFNGYSHRLPSTIGININSLNENLSPIFNSDFIEEQEPLKSPFDAPNPLPLNNEKPNGAFSQNFQPIDSISSSDFQRSEAGLNDLNTILSDAANTNQITTTTQTLPSTFDSLNTVIAPPAPIISKHIYFHVAPPDIEEQRIAPPPPPPKKTYKILFIKVPSQESTNTARLQQLIQSQNTGAEDKTLIYILVKTPEPQEPVVVPQPLSTKSEHEVFFVKYNGDPFEIASQINDELAQTGSIESIVPILQPGLPNGHK